MSKGVVMIEALLYKHWSGSQSSMRLAVGRTVKRLKPSVWYENQDWEASRWWELKRRDTWKSNLKKKISKTFQAELGENNESTDKWRLGFEHHELGNSHHININRETKRNNRYGEYGLEGVVDWHTDNPKLTLKPTIDIGSRGCRPDLWSGEERAQAEASGPNRTEYAQSGGERRKRSQKGEAETLLEM